MSAFVTVSGAGSAISINAGANDAVVLRGLIIEGSGSNAGTGIYSTQVGTLRIQDVKIRNFINGIFIVNSLSNPHFAIQRCDIGEVRYGILVDGSGSAELTFASVTETTVDHADYFAIVSGGARTEIQVRHCVLTHSGLAAFSTPNFGFIRVGTSTLSGNISTADVDHTSNRGAVGTYGDNLDAGYGGSGNYDVSLAYR